MAGHFFADLRKRTARSRVPELATARGLPPPPDAASPSEVMRAYVQATKSGDEKLACAARIGWRLAGEGGRCTRPFDQCLHERLHRARNLLLHKIEHVEPVWEGEPRAAIRGDEFEDAPTVEMVDVVMDHIGNFEGEHRVFNNTEVRGVATAASRRRTVAHQLAQHLAEHSWRTFPIAPWRC